MQSRMTGIAAILLTTILLTTILAASALYRDPDALFLDEGTANLDQENEEAIADMIADLPVTRIVIAHRAALIERAQIVLHVENGRIERRRREPSPA